MNQFPDNRQAYDPLCNFAVDSPLIGSHAYAQASRGHAYGNHSGLPPQDGEYQQLHHQSATTAITPGVSTPTHNQTSRYLAQASGQHHFNLPKAATMNTACVSNAACTSNVAFASNAASASNTTYASNAACSFRTSYPHLSNEQPYQILAPRVSSQPQVPDRPHGSNVLHVGGNHVVGWRGNPSEYQTALAEKGSFNLSKPLSPSVPQQKKNSPKQTGALSVPQLCHPTPDFCGEMGNQSRWLPISTGVLPSLHIPQNKDAPLDFPASHIPKRENVVATPVGGIYQPHQLATAVNMKQETFAVQLGRPTSPTESREPKNVPKPIVASANNTKMVDGCRLALKVKDEPGVRLGALPQESSKKEDPSRRRKSTQQHTDDIFSTIPLKTSKYASQNEAKARRGKAGAMKGERRQGSRVMKSTKTAGKLRGKRGLDSFSLLEHSGDESDNSLQGRAVSRNDKQRPRKRTSTFSDSDDEDFDDIGLGSRQKQSEEKRGNGQCGSSGVRSGNASQMKGGELREGRRRSSRILKRKVNPELESRRNPVKKRREVHRNERKVRQTKSLDELTDSDGAHDELQDANGAQSDSSDSSDDFVPTSEREKRFAEMRAEWEASQKTGEKQSMTPRKGAKRTPTKRTKRKRTPAKGNASDGDNTRADDQTLDSDSPNASQRGSQPLNVKLTSLSTRRRKRKVDYEEERKRLTEDELSTIRLAFVAHYPPPPSNAQAQGRFEMKYGREMSQAMIQGLWENELKHWSERWWSFYMSFNDYVRAKKLAKPVDKNPTVNMKEVEDWAKSFYEEHGDARVSRNGQTPDQSSSDDPASNPSNGSKNRNDNQLDDKSSNSEKTVSDMCEPGADVSARNVMPDNAEVASGAYTSGDSRVPDSRGNIN